MMTEIIKLSSIKDNISAFLGRFVERIKSRKDYDITIILQENGSKQPKHAQIEPLKILDCPEKVTGENSPDPSSDESCNHRSNDQKESRCDEDDEEEEIGVVVSQSIVQVFPNVEVEWSKKDFSSKGLKSQSSPMLSLDDSQCTGKSEQDSEEEEDNHLVVEDKLNLAYSFIENKELNGLEDFLYDFKHKYACNSSRVNIKWRLLMAHCKENRKEYERASINYKYVLQIAAEYPNSLPIEAADIYHRLAICYMNIEDWNNGIINFRQALNRYKSKNQTAKYSLCIHNMGTLYLISHAINEAERCFVISYDIKRVEYGLNSSKLLTTLFNLFECSLELRNFQQASNTLAVASKILQKCKQKSIAYSGLYRRMGKLFFYQGLFEECEKYYDLSQAQITNKFPFCMEQGELFSNFGILRMEQELYSDAKHFFSKSLMILNFYYSKESQVVRIIKQNIDSAKAKINHPTLYQKSEFTMTM